MKTIKERADLFIAEQNKLFLKYELVVFPCIRFKKTKTPLLARVAWKIIVLCGGTVDNAISEVKKQDPAQHPPKGSKASHRG